MRNLKIYMEGGGDSQAGRVALRRGMEALLDPLKRAAREKNLRLRVVCCGPRDRALRSFQKARRTADDEIQVLLVDAEAPVEATPREHLQTRDRWNLAGVDDDAVHLMVQTMEAWIVADSKTLQVYYGQEFNARALPAAPDLESVAKQEVERGLQRATNRTKKGRYHKIRHASVLLRRIDAEAVKNRCRHCRRLFDELGRMIAAV